MLRATVSIKTNTKTWDRMARNLKRNNNYINRVGFFGGTNKGIPIPLIAAWQEEGTLHIPRRPFIRLGFIKEIVSSNLLDKYIPLVDNIAKGGMTWSQLNSSMSKDLQDLMQKQIIQWKSPRNRPSTIRKKGFDDPLIETGKMFDSVEVRLSRRRK